MAFYRIGSKQPQVSASAFVAKEASVRDELQPVSQADCATTPHP